MNSSSSVSRVLRLLAKGREALGGKERIPTGRALVRVERQPEALDPVAVLDQIRLQKDQLKVSSYLNLVPVEYREAVIQLAEKAHPEKGQGRTLEEFTEDMALNWLAKREIFRQVAEEFGFRDEKRVGLDFRGAILALTINGSIVGMNEADSIGSRSILYGRIELREDSDILPSSEGKIMDTARVGARLATTQFNSSPLISLAVKGDAPKGVVRKSVIVMTRSFAGVDRHTIYRPKTGS